VNVNVMNNEKVKLQGPAYYTDCYKWWELNHCKSAFESSEYTQVVSSKFSRMPFWGEMACVDLESHKTFEEYFSSLSKNVKRDILESRSKHLFEEFNINDFVYDFSEINHTQNKKKGSINKWYLQDPNNFLGCNYGPHEWEDENHYSKWFGVFKYMKHYKQGELTTNKKLLAYCRLCVDGEMACISLIWGHAGYMKDGVIFNLIASVVESSFVLDKVKCVLYYAINGKNAWKRRIGFRPVSIEIQGT